MLACIAGSRATETATDLRDLVYRDNSLNSVADPVLQDCACVSVKDSLLFFNS